MFKKSLLIMLLMAMFAPWAVGQKSLPYSYSFEYSSGTAAEALAAEGWTLQNCKSGTGIVSSTSYGSPHTGTYYFQFAYQTNSNQWLVSPELTTSEKNIVVEFYYRKYTSGTETFKVGYSTTTTASDQFTFGEVITCTNTAYPAEPNYSNTFPAGTKYIAIAYVSNNEWYFNLDDITIEEESDCPKPYSLTATNVTHNSATLGWTSNADEWNLQYKASAADEWETINNVTNPYTLNGILSANTTYAFKVQPVCGGASGDYSNQASFTTTITPKNLTYTMGFETTESTEFADWTSNNLNSYSKVNANAKRSGSLGFAFYYQNSLQHLITPPLNTPTGVRIEFYYKCSSATTSYQRSFKVGYSTNSNNVNDFIWDETATTTNGTTWELYSNTFPANTRYIAIQVEVNSNYAGYLYIDDIIIEAPAACEKPTNLISSTTGVDDLIHKIQLSWTAGSTETAWDIKYNADVDFDPETEGTLVENISSNPYVLENLTGGTTYYAYVRGYCPNSTEMSNWNTTVCTFTTENGCARPTALNASALPGAATLSWNDGENNSEGWQIAYSKTYGSTYSPASNSTIITVTTNPYTLDNLDNEATYYCYVRTICDNNDGTSDWSYYKSFTTLATCPTPKNLQATATPDGAVVTWEAGYEETQWQLRWRQYINGSGYTDYTIIGENEPLTTTTYTLTGLEPNTSSYVYVRAYCDSEHQSEWSSQTSFTTLASCPAPTNLHYTSLTSDEVEFDWTAGYQETTWNIRYKTDGDWTTIESTSTKPYTLNVTPNTNYTLQVQSTCDSDWAELTFMTPCLEVVSFPFEEDFEDLTTTSEIPGCWDNDEGTTTNNNYKWCYSTSNSGSYGSTVNTGHNGSKCVRFESYYNSTNYTNFFKTPVMNFPAGKTMVLNFWYRYPAGKDFSVYISTDGGLTYTTALVENIDKVSDWTEQEIVLTDFVEASNVVIVFKGTSNCGSGDANIYLDDVTVSEESDCAKPKDLAVDSYDNHSATLSWDANGSEQPWQVAYSTTENFDLTDPTAYSTATATTNPFTLTGLTNLNTYYVRVRTICGENYSEWNNNGYQSFTTTATFTAPTITGVSEIGDQSATVAWETGDSEETPTHWTVWYKTGDTENTKTVEASNTSTQITGLTAGSAYEVKVRAQSGDDYSAWSTSENFQTAFCAAENQCNISYTLTDSYGDGWNGNSKLEVVYKASNIVVATLKLSSGSTTSGTLALCNNAEYDFVWTAGTADYEDGFVFYDVNNEIIYQHIGGSWGTTAPSAGIVFTYTMDCTVSTCTRPSDLTADAVHPNSVELSWTNEAGQEAWQIAYSTSTFDPNDVNFDLTTVSVAAADSNPFELEGLVNNTTYYAYVRAVCDATNDDYSKWSNTVCEFTTQVACPAPTNVHLVSRPASNQLAIVWTAGYEETNWNLYYRVAGAEEWGEPVAVATTPAYTITGELSTTYEVKVAAVCSGEEGGASDVVTFSTPINVAIGTDFTEVFSGTSCPTGWTTIADNYYYWSFNDEAYSSSYTNNGIFLITPLLYLDNQTPVLSFDQKKKKYSSYNSPYATISVMVSTTGTNPEDFTTIWTSSISELTTSYVNKTIMLSDYANQAVYIAFKYQNNYWYWYIDNVKVSIENTFITEGEWNEDTNWSAGAVPTAEENAYVAAVAYISDEVSVNNITVLNGGSLTIADGGQLKHNNDGVVATVKKNFTGYTNYTGEGNGGYYLIASPVTESLTSQQLTAMGLTPYGNVTGAHYDLYAWDGSQTNEEWQNWENTQNENHHFPLAHYNGYLYANQDDVEVSFTGTLESSENEIGCEVNYNGGGFASLSLWGNPFVCNVYLSSNMEAMAFYRMNDDGDGFIAATGAIKPMEGFFVQAVDYAAPQLFTINRTQPNSSKNININLSQGESLRDRAIVRFGEGNTLEKFSLSNNTTKLYIPQGTKDYAVVRSNSQGEMPVSFKAETNGTYTISVEPENVEVTYLHLIDNRTGANVDLLANPSYTFNANKGDNANRFRLVFKANTDVEDNTATETFAYFNGSEWVISNMGDATLQVIDMMGRVLRSEQINGNTAVNINETAGIYMLRLVNGENVMVQKVVVK
jgi:hypothetical protein